MRIDSNEVPSVIIEITRNSAEREEIGNYNLGWSFSEPAVQWSSIAVFKISRALSLLFLKVVREHRFQFFFSPSEFLKRIRDCFIKRSGIL